MAMTTTSSAEKFLSRLSFPIIGNHKAIEAHFDFQKNIDSLCTQRGGNVCRINVGDMKMRSITLATRIDQFRMDIILSFSLLIKGNSGKSKCESISVSP
jgi:hypothetical protein